MHVNVYVTLPLAAGVSTCVPLVASDPLQPSLALHVLALVVDQVSVALCPTVIVVGAIDSITEGASGGPMFPPP